MAQSAIPAGAAHGDTGSSPRAALSAAEGHSATAVVPSTGTPRRAWRWQSWSAALVSMLTHAILLLLMAVLVLGQAADPWSTVLVLSTSQPEDATLESIELSEPLDPVEAVSLRFEALSNVETASTAVAPEVSLMREAAAPMTIELRDFTDQAVPSSDLMREAGALARRALEGRGTEMRGTLLARYGGSEASERAVALALAWFAEHQRPDGSWTFDQRGGPCRGQCSQHGEMDQCFTGATALALLPFLGAGQTHEQGRYKDHVERGLRYLLRVQNRRTGALISGGGSMYSHGLSTIALCEAYAMTRATFLKDPAQAALAFVCYAQDSSGGGWRYVPQTPGDTSVVAWQLMALKSGHMASLEFPPETVLRVSKFLSLVASDGGATYGYTSGLLPRPSTTAAGLLCRMYLGWKRDEPALVRGVDHLSRLGPALHPRDTQYHMYYNYYATQVLRHYGGPQWEQWNEVLRDHLVRTQIVTDHMAGSWDIPLSERPDLDVLSGGRLYYTSLATMILEVYYRHMPLYSETAAEDEFPL